MLAPIDPHRLRAEMTTTGRRIKSDRHQERDHRTLRAEWRLVKRRDRIGRGERSGDFRACHQPDLRYLRRVDPGLQLRRLGSIPGAVDQVVVGVQPGLLQPTA
jgi:hypothetical protein